MKRLARHTLVDTWVMFRVLATSAVCCCFVGAVHAADFSGRYVLTLEDALVPNYRPDEPLSPQPLRVHVICENGQWGDIWAAAMTFNRAMHVGEVVDVKTGDDRVRLEIALEISGDPWVKGGAANFELELMRNRGQVEGSYTGEFVSSGGTYRAKGRVTGTVHSPETPPHGFQPAPFEPRKPRTEVPRIEAPKDYRPGRGVPVQRLEPGKMPRQWIWVGPFEHRVYQHPHPWHDYHDPVDCLAAVGGMEKVQPEVGRKVSFRSQTFSWQEVPEKAITDKDWSGRERLDSSQLSGNRENRHLFFFTVIENDKPGYYRCIARFYEGKCLLGGQRVLDEEIVYLGKGRFPVLVPVTMADGEYMASLVLEEASEDHAKRFYTDPAREHTYQKVMAQWEADTTRWKEADGGIQGQRSFAADFTGKAGVPAVFVVVDKITGGKRKAWIFQPPRSEQAELRIDGNTFTVKYPDASMKATVISPANARIVKARGAGAPQESGVPDIDKDVLQVTGGNERDGEFLVVMTLQMGDAPDVKLQGSGLEAEVHVGRQQYSFDGRRIAFAQ